MTVILLPTKIVFHLSTIATFTAVLLFNQLQQRFHPSFKGTSVVDRVEETELEVDRFLALESNDTDSSRLHRSDQEVILFSHHFACGGGLVSTTAASLVSFPCEYQNLHKCCVLHDTCFDARIGQEKCDEFFCDCLANLPSESAYCNLFTHYGLCASTRLLGHFFYEDGPFNQTAFELLGAAGHVLLDSTSKIASTVIES
ncbi:hypothetical protein M3Y98_00843800 [Aphelenchoides besseyi]|nr:hypothetical protein M3Y98_00843800 [Aphelenchoides besseyi]KAI6202475.1 hypothetical protein M3Y96_00953000 [Aphelenchoides besseyi]